MRLARWLLALTFVCAVMPAAVADGDDDELVLLTAEGQLRDRSLRDRVQADRLKPAGGLFLSFDANGDGRVTVEEVDAGIIEAFSAADGNDDGKLTALEQQDWARSLPTRDETLANPARFDPNLDKRVEPDEFAAVIRAIGADYSKADNGEILLADLKAPRREGGRIERGGERMLERQAQGDRDRLRR